MTYNVSNFNITDDAIASFRRFIKKPRDCVINAMELINLIDKYTADMCRIMVGDIGLTAEQIEGIFKLIYPTHNWNFYQYTNIISLDKISQTELKRGTAIFCGYSGPKGTHVFLIAKKLSGEVYYLDPQLDLICPLTDPRCVYHISNQTHYYVLQDQKKNQKKNVN